MTARAAPAYCRPYLLRRARKTLFAVVIAAIGLPAQGAALSVTVTDREGKPLADAVVYVMVRTARAQASPGTMAQIAQRDRQFQPRVTVVQTGTAVQFPNLDSVRHHVYSFSPAKTFELRLYSGTPATPVLFDKPGTATLGCNIHDRMTAWVHVVDTPYFAKTDAQGRATLELPVGEHRLHAWHRALPQPDSQDFSEALRIGAEARLVRLRLDVDAGAAE